MHKLWETRTLEWQCRSATLKEVGDDDEDDDGTQHVGWGGIFQVEEEPSEGPELCALGEWEGLPEYIHQVVKEAIEGKAKDTPVEEMPSAIAANNANLQGSWEVLAAGEVSWRKKIKGGYRITFLQDSGAVRTIATKNMIPGMKVYRTKHTGSSFRVANGHFVPNEGEVKLMGRSSNNNGMCIKAQVADITRPLAATAEMVDAGNIVINHKDGGVIKQVTQEQLERIMRAISNEPGLEIPVYRKRNTFLIDVDIPDPTGDVSMGGGGAGRK